MDTRWRWQKNRSLCTIHELLTDDEIRKFKIVGWKRDEKLVVSALKEAYLYQSFTEENN